MGYGQRCTLCGGVIDEKGSCACSFSQPPIGTEGIKKTKQSFWCRIGLHKWDGCICIRHGCGKKRNIEHHWTNWKFVEEGKCERERVCERLGCSVSEKLTWHEDAQPITLDDDLCARIVNCKRCNKLLNQYKSHDFKDGKCQRCGEPEPPPSDDDERDEDWSGYGIYRQNQGH